MIDGRGVRSDCLFKMHLGVIEGDRYEKHNANETCGDAGDALGHTQPFIKSVGGAESSQRVSIRVDD